eukprot:UN06100
MSDLEYQLAFVQNWKGLDIKKCKSKPKTFKAYLLTSQCWLNRNRSVHYANGHGLFMKIFKDLMDHSDVVSSHQNNFHQATFAEMLFHTYIGDLLNAKASSSALICSVSVENNGELKSLLTEYSNGLKIKSSKQIAEYFINESAKTLNLFQVSIQMQYRPSRASCIGYTASSRHAPY